MKITQEAIRQIELIHSSWLRFEVAGEHHKLVSLCADDVQLRPPDEVPLVGRNAVLAWLAQDVKRVHHIEINDFQVAGSSEIAYLTAGYRTTFSSPKNYKPQEVCGNHLLATSQLRPCLAGNTRELVGNVTHPLRCARTFSWRCSVLSLSANRK
jgi:ketosteroid isomerase-like protein